LSVDDACQPLPNGFSTEAFLFGPNSLRLQGDFDRCLQLRNSQVTADFTGQEVIDLTMSWNRTCLIITGIEVKTMLSALSKQLASMILKMLN